MGTNLRRGIGLVSLVGIEVGQSIGAGIFALAGVAFSYTGTSLYLAFVAAAIPVAAALAALASLASARPTTGGTYVYGARYCSRGAAFLGVWAYMLGALLGMFPLYAITGARFLQAVFPAIPTVPAAFAMARDGMFPRPLAAVNRRFGTPHWLLTLVFAVSSFSLVLPGTGIEVFAAFASIGGILVFVPAMIGALRLRRLDGPAWEAAPFRLRGFAYYAAPATGLLLSGLAAASRRGTSRL